jgi:hypothetical protein
LFYRGVAHLDSPLRVVRETASDALKIYRFTDLLQAVFPAMWLVDVRADGSIAARSVDANIATDSKLLATIPAKFVDSDFGDGQTLRDQLRDALVGEGLFRDEAQALLTTWDKSYFKSPGTRLFFLVNPEWTNEVLPLYLSKPAEVTRVMVGRIELVTRRQRDLIREVEQTALENANVPLRQACPAYDELGRFRNAILLDENERRPNANLSGILQMYGIRAFEIP